MYVASLTVQYLVVLAVIAGKSRSQALECEQESCEEKRIEPDRVLARLPDNKAKEVATIWFSMMCQTSSGARRA